MLLRFPIEVIERIADLTWEFGLRHLTTRKLRLTCKTLAAVCTRTLFGTVILHPDHLDRFYAIQGHRDICLQVHKVLLRTIEPLSEYDEGKAELTEAWRGAITSIGKFSNLSSLEVVFTPECCDKSMGIYSDEVFQDIEFRTELLKIVLAALCMNTSPAADLRRLSIQNLQDLNHKIITTSSDFDNVLSRLGELHLHIVADDEDACPENNINHASLHNFFDELPRVWLKPVSQRLTQLTMYAETFWGWAPVFDPRSVQLPSLKYLALGNYTIAHDWQIDWITSHGPTLETLVLDDCPILFYMSPSGCMDDHLSAISHEDHEQFWRSESDDRSHWIYNRRWHHFYPKFEAKLPHLTKFAAGHVEGESMKEAFEGRDKMLSSLSSEQYIAFDGGIGPSQWVEIGSSEHTESIRTAKGDTVKLSSPALEEPPYQLIPRVNRSSGGAQNNRNSKNDGASPADSFSDAVGCQEDDEEALWSLLEAVNRRARMQGIA